MNTNSDEPYTQPFPAGIDHPGYKLAFRAWVVMFLILICVGLLNFLAIKLGWGK